ncbi:Kinesin-like protein KIF20A [Habropoda laboriosa]|uniref:Kinesin-like protein KIF20A n=1 Tax=Habropoda laboriosa TaxID=597456 RepID=A0A0L7QS20_9HYME|nr:Kinesin-like protein KIF20A [Habropoda laboriosa]
MDNTLDSIRPSYNINPEEMSYLFGRDPSILAYGQRPCVSKDAKKNLISVYEVEDCTSIEESGSLNSELQDLQTVKVYLRMKPFPKKLKLTQEQQDAYQVINLTTLYTKLPALDNNTSCLKRSNSTDIVCRKFTFTKTFGPETTQLDLFEQAVKQQMIDFLGGQNSTIMTYGTTNSGKSYTLQGTTTSPGIIPRGLEFVFSNITPKSTPSYKPMNHCDVVTLDPLERAQELEIKTKLLTFASVDKSQYINAYKEMQKLLQEESPIRPSQCIGAHYSVWVSFAEIYNEIVYDLLSNECQKKRTALKLATDNQGRAFIKGLKTVCVNSGSEAYQVLMAGQYNLKVAATALNARSSRSHCIFTIKLLKYYIENDPNSVEVSTFAFCDLAGSERLKKTLNIGDRLKEAQNINTSLLVLGRCLKTIHEGQLSKQKIEHIGPFRESKLTRLFQKALSGKEHIALIVNINPLPNLYIETQSVLNFSAIAKKIVIEKEKVHKKNKSRFSQIVTQSIKTVTDWDVAELESGEWLSTVDDNGISHYQEMENYGELMSENKKLKQEIAILKSSALTRDLQIRQEMADTYTAMMKELETEWKNRIKDVEEQQEDVLQWSVKQVEDFYKEKLNQVSSCKRRRSSLSTSNLQDNSRNTEKLEIENSCLTSKIVLLKSTVKELKEANQTLTIEKNKTTFELGLTKEDLKNVKNLLNAAQQDVCSDEETKHYVEELLFNIFNKLKVFLNEAKEEYIAITTDVREKEYVIKEQEEELFEKQETIEDLEEDLAHINICLTEKIKAVEILEEKLENQTKKMLDNDNKLQNMQEQINKLENEKLLMLDELELIKKTAVAGNSIIKDLKHKNDECEISCDFLKEEEEEEEDKKCVIKEKLSFDPKVEIIIEDSSENDQEIDTGRGQLETHMKEKIIAIEAENSALREKLVRSTTEIQSLKDELESTKVKVKDISEQISNLKISNIQSKVENDENKEHKVAVETIEIGCQAHIESDEHSVDASKNDVLNKSSQTIQSLTIEKINQTSFIEDTDEHDITLDKLAKLTVKYDDIKTEYKKKYLMLEEVEKEVLILRQRIEKLSEENDTNKVDIEEYKQSIVLLQKELFIIKEEKKEIEETLKSTDNIKVSMEIQISDYEQRLNEAEQQLSITKNDYQQCVEKLNTLQAGFDTYVSKCKNEHEEIITNLQKDLSSALEKCNIKSQCLDVHTTKIMELEHNLEGITELQQKIDELNRNLKTCQTEKDTLQKLFDENNDRLLDLEDRLESTEENEREKDAEIITLQKELKDMIQRSEYDDRSDKLMEIEMKNTIKKLTTMKEMLTQKEEYIEHLEERIKQNEQNAKILELLQESSQERQAENERLRALNEELKNGLMEKDREMETFMRNRDEMVAKYESLVKCQQEALEKQKRELPKNYSKQTEYCENTSEDEVALKERRTRRAPRKYSPSSSSKQDEISVVELSSSDSKRGRVKNSNRKKKLFISQDESFQDIEPVESTVTITPSQTRSLRSRRKL